MIADAHIYQLTKVIIYSEDKTENKIYCSSVPFGYFENTILAEEFIRKHNKAKNCFFILKSYIFNPLHNSQCIDFITERTYNYKGDLLCDCPTHHFIINKKNLFGQTDVIFKGRNNNKFKKEDIAWFYNSYEKTLEKCQIKEIPWTPDQVKKHKEISLEWYDDSYLVYPVEDNKNHQHIISCYMFTDDFIESCVSNC